VRYFESELPGFDSMLFKLSGGDISKTERVEELEACFCYEWLYTLKVSELNGMKYKIAEWKKMKE
ncbi:MAG TPA: hypothetical protein VHP30_06675, partial [Ignavibacteriales bacterium]|nr:hypothetical protein [Ignavibacteriales bacterium]